MRASFLLIARGLQSPKPDPLREDVEGFRVPQLQWGDQRAGGCYTLTV